MRITQREAFRAIRETARTSAMASSRVLRKPGLTRTAPQESVPKNRWDARRTVQSAPHGDVQPIQRRGCLLGGDAPDIEAHQRSAGCVYTRTPGRLSSSSRMVAHRAMVCSCTCARWASAKRIPACSPAMPAGSACRFPGCRASCGAGTCSRTWNPCLPGAVGRASHGTPPTARRFRAGQAAPCGGHGQQRTAPGARRQRQMAGGSARSPPAAARHGGGTSRRRRRHPARCPARWTCASWPPGVCAGSGRARCPAPECARRRQAARASA